jgi:hypothetical protein
MNAKCYYQLHSKLRLLAITLLLTVSQNVLGAKADTAIDKTKAPVIYKIIIDFDSGYIHLTGFNFKPDTADPVVYLGTIPTPLTIDSATNTTLSLILPDGIDDGDHMLVIENSDKEQIAHDLTVDRELSEAEVIAYVDGNGYVDGPHYTDQQVIDVVSPQLALLEAGIVSLQELVRDQQVVIAGLEASLTALQTDLASHSVASAAHHARYSNAEAVAATEGEHFSGAYADLSGTPSLATVASSGAYSDLTGAPALATVATSGAYGDLSGIPELAVVATSGAYADLNGTPALAAVATSGAYSDLGGTPVLATVATTGSYNDLSDKPSLATVATSGAYADLSDLPDLSGYLDDPELAELGNYLTVDSGEIYIDGANLHIRNGEQSTDANPNGLGNLIIGYNERRVGGDECEQWNCNRRIGSHYLIVGGRNNYSAYGGIVAGYENESSGGYATVSGGNYSIASGKFAVVSGGYGGEASGWYSSISGGSMNAATHAMSSVSGGESNIADKFYASVSGGYRNIASGYYSSVGGGSHNQAIGNYSTVGGGSAKTTPNESEWTAGSVNENLASQQGDITALQTELGAHAGDTTAHHTRYSDAEAIAATAGEHFSGAYAELSGTPQLAPVASSGAYADLTGAPALATVATTGAYTDLNGTPALATVATSGAYSDLVGTPVLATVATTGSYNDLNGVPDLSGYATQTWVGNQGYINDPDIADLGDYLTVDLGEVYIDGANLHIRNGLGWTIPASNGLGNLIIGYNPLRPQGGDDRTGSHYLVMGERNNYSSYGGIVVGFQNEASGYRSLAIGGAYNHASGSDSVAIGGSKNDAGGDQSIVSGGHLNETIGFASSVSGGRENKAIGYYSTVSGGFQRNATGFYDWAAGSLWEED